MHILRIPRKQNIGTVAGLFSDLGQYAPRCAIQIPSDLDEYRLCGKGDFLQFLFTWATWCPEAPVVTHIPPETSNSSALIQLRKLFSEEHGFLLGLLARRFGLSPQRRFLDTRLNDLSPEVVEDAFLSSRIFELNQPISKGTRTFLAIDNLMDQDGSVLNPYAKVYIRRNPNYLTMKEAFKTLLETTFARLPKRVAKLARASLNLHANFLEQVSQFTYEIFENADRWGAYPYEKSIRGILAHFHFRESIGERPFHVQVGTDNPLSLYLRHFCNEEGYERTAFLELTIFDNGPTLATHYLGKEPKPLRAEYKATTDCLLLASGRSAKSSEGKGLYETMKLLNASHGFLRYRAKRLNLYRDFIANPLNLEELALLENEELAKRQTGMRKHLFLNDWHSRNTRPKPQAKAVGTFFTFIVPVEDILK